jgi:LacI family transcriptional regulator
MPIYALGERAALRLIETLRGGGTAVPANHEILPAQLVIRSSWPGTADMRRRI